jgi:hypothetical protein
MVSVPNSNAEVPDGPIVELLSFEARANDSTVNSRDAFQRALAVLAQAGHGTLHIPKGQYYVDFPDLASDIDPHVAANGPLIQANSITRAKLILVPPNVRLLGDTDARGNPNSQIRWKTSGFPLFSFANSDHSSIKNVGFIYDGVQPHFFPWSQERYLASIGLPARWLGGPEEISTVIYTIGSERLQFENLTFTSSSNTNDHTFAFGIVSKGKSPLPIPSRATIERLPLGSKLPGGGLSSCATGNVYRNLRFSNFVMGILASGQCGPLFENISGNDRGSWFQSVDPTHEPTSGKLIHLATPGHLIYLTFQQVYDVIRSPSRPDGEMAFAYTVRNTNVTLRDISEGPRTFSNFHALGTLALKNIDGGVVDGVTSHHPAGLIEALIDAHHLTLNNLTWTSDRDLCSEPDSKQNCYVHAIGIVSGGLDLSTQINDHLTFSNITLKSPRWASIIEIGSSVHGAPLSHDITVDRLRIECSPNQAIGQPFSKGIITIRAADTHFTNVTYSPIVAPEGATSPLVNYAVVIAVDSVRTTVQLNLTRVAGIPEGSPIYRIVAPQNENEDAVIKYFVN